VPFKDLLVTGPIAQAELWRGSQLFGLPLVNRSLGTKPICSHELWNEVRCVNLRCRQCSGWVDATIAIVIEEEPDPRVGHAEWVPIAISPAVRVGVIGALGDYGG
jgi:hypothetical protein